MKLKKEYAVLAAVILALVSYLSLRQSDRTHYKLPDLPEVAADKISRLEIRTADASIVLDKKDGKWFVGPKAYPADAGKVSEMLNVVKSLGVTALVSESKNYVRYDLDDSKRIDVKAWSGKTLSREFAIGKAASTFRHTHVLLAGDSNVYHAEDNFRSKFEQSVEKLRDKSVLGFDANMIEAIEIAEGGKTTKIIRTDLPLEEGEGGRKDDAEASKPPEMKTVWKTADGKSAEESKLKSVLSTLSRLQCEAYLEEEQKEALKNPLRVLTLKEGSQSHVLSIFPKSGKDAENYPALSSAGAYPFLLPAYQVDNMKKSIDEMLKTDEKP